MSIAAELDSAWSPSPTGADDGPVILLDLIEESLRRGNIPSALSMIRAIRRQVDEPLCCIATTHPELTERELSTLVLLPDATLSQKDMARDLGITRNTLKTHLRSLYQKLGAHSRAEAIELAGLATGRVRR